MRCVLLGLGAALLGTAGRAPALRGAAAADCPADGVHLKPFNVEFGWETTTAVPHAFWLHQCGKLLSTASCGGARMRSVYWFSRRHENTTCQRGIGWRGLERDHDGKYEGAITYDEVFAGTPLRQWTPAPHRAHYRALPAPAGLAARRTSVYVINKYHERHLRGAAKAPASSFSLPLIEKMLTDIEAQCPDTGVVYYNNWHFTDPADDLPGSVVLPLVRADGESDTDVVARYPNAQSLKDLAAPGQDLNALEMSVMARHACFLAVQGGDQAFAASFGGAHVVLDLNEADHAEPDGFYLGTLPRLAGGSFHRVRSERAFLAALAEVVLADGCSRCAV